MSDQTTSAPQTVSNAVPQPAYLNLKEAADYLRVSASLISKLVYKRDLRPGRIGRRLIFKRAELDRYADLQMALAS